jgi:hypothetical protein
MLVCLFYGVLTPLSKNFQFYRGGQFFLVEETGGQGENQLNFLCTSFGGLKYWNHK